MRDPDFVELCTWAGLEAEYLRRKLDVRLRAVRQRRETFHNQLSDPFTGMCLKIHHVVDTN